MYSNIYGFKIFSGSKRELIQSLKKFNKVHIVSGNPEVLSEALKNKKLYNNFISDKSIIIPDGIGTVICSKIIGQPVKEKIAGIEVMQEILYKCEREQKSVYFLGAKDHIVKKCVENIKIKYPKLKVAGYHNGYFDLNQCEDLINDIKTSNAFAIFVAMGCPRQETFIIDNMKELPCKIFMGIGGSFDVFAGKVNRAPKWMIKIGLEWLYRVLKEPWRIKRLKVIPIFMCKAIFYHLRKQ